MKSLVYILGSGRSGSTLLDQVLGGHPSVAALGEVHRFSMSLKSDTQPHYCTCGKAVRDCEFWKPVVDQIVDERGQKITRYYTTQPKWESLPDDADKKNIVELVPRRGILASTKFSDILSILGSKRLVGLLKGFSNASRIFHSIYQNSWELYRKVSETHRRPIVIDTTKTPGRYLGLAMYRPSDIEMTAIHLIRDGRAVAFARHKRQNISMHAAAKYWVAEQRKILLAKKRRPEIDCLIVHYEQLCASPEKETKRIYDYLGLDAVSLSANVKDGSHALGGNPMRWRKHEATIRLDEKWKAEISESQLADFDRIAGKINRSYGYE